MTDTRESGTYPSFAELLERQGALSGTSWGLFPQPDRGTPSFITQDTILEARNCIRTGVVFGLDYPADAFDPGMSLKRSAPRHTIYSSHPAHRDDYLDGYYLQGSTQVDGLRHRRADDIGFYNGTPDDRITEGTPDLGIQEWADKPIVGRGVLVDLDGYRTGEGTPIDHAAGEPLGLDLIQATIQAQSLTIQPGDILMLHTGWCEWFLALAMADSGQHLQGANAQADRLSRHGVFEEAFDNLLALRQVALLHEALGLHVGHVPPGAGVFTVKRYLCGGGCVACRQRIIPQIPGLAGIKPSQNVFGVTHGNGLAPSLQCLGCQLQPPGQFLNYFSCRFTPTGLEQRDVAG